MNWSILFLITLSQVFPRVFQARNWNFTFRYQVTKISHLLRRPKNIKKETKASGVTSTCSGRINLCFLLLFSSSSLLSVFLFSLPLSPPLCLWPPPAFSPGESLVKGLYGWPGELHTSLVAHTFLPKLGVHTYSEALDLLVANIPSRYKEWVEPVYPKGGETQSCILWGSFVCVP